MKKYFSYALVGAIALSGAVGFSSCSSSSDEVVGNNPDYNPELNSVKTQFTISFQNNVAGTRQSEGIVQGQVPPTIEDFRGMDNIVLLPFGATGAVNTNPIGSTSTKLGNAIDLKSIIVPGTQSVTNSIPAGFLQENSNSVLYNDVTIPVGTGSFLFYGKAIDANGGNFVNGSLAMTGDEPGSITFTPVKTNPESTVSATGAYLADYLSKIAQATNWAGCADTENSTQPWYNVGLGDLYTKFTSLKTGSSLDVQAAIEDLYETIKGNTDDVSTAIKDAILDADYVTNTSNPATLSFDAKLGNSFTTGEGKTLYFPFDVNLPDGAALLKYDTDPEDETKKIFSQVTNGVGNPNTGTTETTAYADYVYPASLYYYCNSGITTSASSKKSLYEDTEHNYDWAAITGTTNYEAGSSVKTSTRSVAIVNPIQYAVGRLDATVKLGDATTLYDKNGEAYAVNTTDGFTVTGILIGGQKQVKFDFTQNTSATEYTIYDNITKSNGKITVKSTTACDPNHTLALETKAGESVYVAVELLNNGADFQGIDGVVPAGCKFYLVGQLNPTSVTDSEKNPNSLTQVFKQDHKTIANFTIPQGYPKTDTAEGHFNPSTGNTVGLGKAYNTIPDLRSPKLELGLSVDLRWESGITFDVDF